MLADNKTFYCSFVYAGNKVAYRRSLWDNLRLLKHFVGSKSWVLLGDFNVALNIEDSSTGSSGISKGMCDFKDCIEDIVVLDINHFGLHFTWNQQPNSESGILKKFDRIMGNDEFIADFPNSFPEFLPYGISNHSPCILKFPSINREKPRNFELANFVTKKPAFVSLGKKVWSKEVYGYKMYKIVCKMHDLKKPLRKMM